MTTYRAVLTVLASCLAIISLTSVAHADLTKNGRFVFRGRIDHGDPVNLLFAGGTDFCSGSRRRSSNCVKTHFENDWHRGRMTGKFCNGGGRATFYTQDGGIATASQDDNLSTSLTCRTQFHARIWDDAEHGHGDTHQWVIVAMHHETRPTSKRGHSIDLHWETVENIAVQQMGRDQGGFNDSAHCTYPDYYALPGSGPGKINNRYTNGRISRISFHHVENDGCDGQ
jgi:hypothetical protein